MLTLKAAVDDFLAQKRIAVAGVSASTPNQAANLVYRTLKKRGYEVFALNPKASDVEGDACYPDLKSVPGGVHGVLIATPPNAAGGIVRECVEQGISRVWMHRSFGKGSVPEAAAELCRNSGIVVIAGGCPMMFLAGTDFGHRCMRWFLNMTGGLPKSV